VGALIFDFDGVIADSEAIANTVAGGNRHRARSRNHAGPIAGALFRPPLE
jgi:hypothetical protein